MNCKQCKMDVTISDEFRGEMFKTSEYFRICALLHVIHMRMEIAIS